MVDEILLVSENYIETAISLLLQIEKTVAEGAGAAGLAALLAHPERLRGRKVGLVLTGGNIDTRLLATVLLRDLARSGRMARLRRHGQGERYPLRDPRRDTFEAQSRGIAGPPRRCAHLLR